MKIAVYTAVFGGKDELKDPLHYKKDPNIDYFIFTDNFDLKSDIYQIINKPVYFTDITKNARYYKILGTSELDHYDILIWHDANLQIFHNRLYDLIKFLGKNSVATFKHPHRNCVYKESIACIRREKDKPRKITKQIFFYFLKGMPTNFGLYETAILLKRKSSDLDNLLNFWWNEIIVNSRRDQISLVYSLWKLNGSINLIPGSREKNNFSKFSNHIYTGYKVNNEFNRQYSKIQKSIFISIILSFRWLVSIVKFRIVRHD